MRYVEYNILSSFSYRNLLKYLYAGWGLEAFSRSRRFYATHLNNILLFPSAY